MDQNAKQLKQILIFGSISGGAICLFELLFFLFAMLNNKALSNISGILFIIGGYVSVRYYRNEINKGFISFKRAYRVAFLTMLLTGLVWAIYEFILRKYLSPNLLEEELLIAQENLLRLGWPEERVDAFTTLGKPMAFTSALGYFIYAAIGGSLVSLIIAALLKRDENPLLKDE